MSANYLETSRPAAAVAPHAGEADLPDHRVSFSERDGWALWRTICLRGAGFPATEVLKLSAPAAAAAADRLLDAEELSGPLWGAALKSLHAELRDASPDDLPRLEKIIRRLRKKKLPPPDPELAGEGRRLVEELRDGCGRLDAAREGFREAHADSTARVSEALQEVARDGRFREAVTWQNRQAIRTGLDALLREAPKSVARGSKQRQHEELVANYLQRYCVKNDTIGFFGPVGWARFVPQGENLVVNPGPRLLAARGVYFESWCIDALARKLGEDGDLRPWLVPRRLPFVRLEGTTLFMLSRQRINISLQQAAVFHACNGVRTARQVAALVTRVPSVGLRGEGAVYEVLAQMSGTGLIAWGLEVPVGVRAEENLKDQLARVEDERLRAAALAPLAELEQTRRRVEAAAGNAEELDAALTRLDETFTRLTGEATTRSSGKTYAARTLVYEDCRRDVDVRVGPEFLKALEPLGLLLTSARWLARELAADCCERTEQYYRELVEEHGSKVVECMELWLRARPLLTKKLDLGVTEKFQERWAQVLALPDGQRRVQYASEHLRPRVLSAFGAPKPDAPGALYHSPDVMIAATGPEAIRRGDFTLVLGEMHLAANTLGAMLFVEQHPAPEELHRALKRDCPRQRVMPVPPKNLQSLTTRTAQGFIRDDDLLLEFAPDSCGVPPSQSLPISTLVVEPEGGQLVVRTRDGSRRFDVATIFGEAIFNLAIDYFRILGHEPHTPRVTIDRLVVCREAWTFAAGEFPFAREKDEAERFLSARRWARSLGLPRFVFAKVPVEVKPFYVDFDSPVYVDIFAKMVRRTMEHDSAEANVYVSEMLPDAEHAWLPDAEGRRYTSELRVVAVDLWQ
jgi:hypothetical protein